MKKRTAHMISTTMAAAYVVAAAFLVVFAKISIVLKIYIAISTLVIYVLGSHIRELYEKNYKLRQEIEQLKKRV